MTDRTSTPPAPGLLRDLLIEAEGLLDPEISQFTYERETKRRKLAEAIRAALRAESVAAPVLTYYVGEAAQRLSVEEVADAMVFAVLDGTFADSTVDQVRHAVYELVGRAALHAPPALDAALVRTYRAAAVARAEVSHTHLGANCPMIELDAALADVQRNDPEDRLSVGESYRARRAATPASGEPAAGAESPR